MTNRPVSTETLARLEALNAKGRPRLSACDCKTWPCPCACHKPQPEPDIEKTFESFERRVRRG
jgi:hypothetical protein